MFYSSYQADALEPRQHLAKATRAQSTSARSWRAGPQQRLASDGMSPFQRGLNSSNHQASVFEVGILCRLARKAISLMTQPAKSPLLGVSSAHQAAAHGWSKEGDGGGTGETWLPSKANSSEANCAFMKCRISQEASLKPGNTGPY